MSRTISKYISLCLVLLAAIFFAGCGSDNKEGAYSDVAFVSESACAACHGSSYDSKTGEEILPAYHASAHFTAEVGCQDCHGGGALHNGVGPLPYPNPAASFVCLNCHGPSNTPTSSNHFKTYTTSYVNAISPTRDCSFCHKGHNPGDIPAQATEWKLNHGNVAAGAFARDFAQYGSYSSHVTAENNTYYSECQRCHTTAGYLKFVDSNFMDVSYVVNGRDPNIGKKGSKLANTRGVIACGACHLSVAGQLRDVGAGVGITAHYNDIGKTQTLATIQYKDIGKSNMCVACHQGRTAGATIKNLPEAVYSAAANINSVRYPHDMPTALTFLGAGKGGGYEVYSSSYYNNLSYYAHDKIGVANYNGTGVKGACAYCHMKAGSHSFDVAANVADIEGSGTGACAACHKAPYYTPGQFADVEEEFHAARKALMIITQRVLTIDTTNRSAAKIDYKSKAPAGAVAEKANHPLNGRNNMGAGFNAAVMYYENGAFAHNYNYTKWLIFDSINWLSATTMDPINARHGAAAKTQVKAAICGITETSVDTSITDPETWSKAVDATPALKFLGFPDTTSDETTNPSNVCP